MVSIQAESVTDARLASIIVPQANQEDTKMAVDARQ